MVHIYALGVGYLELDRASMLSDLPPGMPWTVPVSSYLVVHPEGRLLFDTGVHCQTLTDPIGRMGAERARRIRIRSHVGDDVVSQLARTGLQPDDITYGIDKARRCFMDMTLSSGKPSTAYLCPWWKGDECGSVAGCARLTAGRKRVTIGVSCAGA